MKRVSDIPWRFRPVLTSKQLEKLHEIGQRTGMWDGLVPGVDYPRSVLQTKEARLFIEEYLSRVI